jgi:NADH:ubiquinone oxidoreductase subunit 3 (subunit A)
MKAQGIVEYALILVLVLVVVVVVLGVLSPFVDPNRPPCSKNEASFECKNWKVQQCLKTEQYTKDQCVILIGGGK